MYGYYSSLYQRYPPEESAPSPHVYSFAVHQEILSETEFLFSEFNPFEADCCCFPYKTLQATEYSFHQMPPILMRLKEYVYQQLTQAGFSVKDSGRLILVEYRSLSDHASLPKHMFKTPASSRVSAVMVMTKDKGIYDSGLLLRQRVPLKNIKTLTVEHTVKTDLKEGYGIMYHEDQYVEFVGGDGCFRMVCLSFDKK